MDTSSERRIYGFILLPETVTYDNYYLCEAITDLAMRAWNVKSEQGLEKFNDIEVLACADIGIDGEESFGVVSLIGRPRAQLKKLTDDYLEDEFLSHFEINLRPEDGAPIYAAAAINLGIGDKKYGEAWTRFIALGLGRDEQCWIAEMQTALQTVPPGTTLWVDSLTGNVLQRGTIFDRDTRCGPYPL